MDPLDTPTIEAIAEQQAQRDHDAGFCNIYGGSGERYDCRLWRSHGGEVGEAIAARCESCGGSGVCPAYEGTGEASREDEEKTPPVIEE